MARQYKRTNGIDTAWNYQRQIEKLNRASEQGWQLIRTGAFSNKFKWNPDMRYRYQIDYAGRVEDKGRYLETFREQGWEYVDHCWNGWYVFRKVYDPAMPEEQYEIFTDRNSLEQMKRRWTKVVIAVLLFDCVAFGASVIQFIFENTLPHLIQMATLGIPAGFLVYGILAMKKTGKRKMARWDGLLFAVFLLVILAGSAATITLTNNRPYFNVTYSSEETAALPAERENATEWTNIDIVYSDNYYLTLEIEADSLVHFVIEDESGQTVYEERSASVKTEGHKLYLEKGLYTIYMNDFDGGALNVIADIS